MGEALIFWLLELYNGTKYMLTSIVGTVDGKYIYLIPQSDYNENTDSHI